MENDIEDLNLRIGEVEDAAHSLRIYKILLRTGISITSFFAAWELVTTFVGMLAAFTHEFAGVNMEPIMWALVLSGAVGLVTGGITTANALDKNNGNSLRRELRQAEARYRRAL